MRKKLMPDLPIYESLDGSLLGIDVEKLPRVANDLAAVLEAEHLNLRTSVAAISHVLGWLAWQAQFYGSSPEEFLKDVAQQAHAYCREFSHLGR